MAWAITSEHRGINRRHISPHGQELSYDLTTKGAFHTTGTLTEHFGLYFANLMHMGIIYSHSCWGKTRLQGRPSLRYLAPVHGSCSKLAPCDLNVHDFWRSFTKPYDQEFEKMWRRPWHWAVPAQLEEEVVLLLPHLKLCCSWSPESSCSHPHMQWDLFTCTGVLHIQTCLVRSRAAQEKLIKTWCWAKNWIMLCEYLFWPFPKCLPPRSERGQLEQTNFLYPRDCFSFLWRYYLPVITFT